MPTTTVTAEKVEERWTTTTAHAVFALPSLSREMGLDDGLSIDLPLLNLGWTFALSLAPKFSESEMGALGNQEYGYYNGGWGYAPSSFVTHTWNTVALALHRYGRNVPWGNTSMRAEISLTMDPPAVISADLSPSAATPSGVPHPNSSPPPSNCSTLLGTMEKIALASSRPPEIKLAPSILSLSSTSKISLTLTISECSLSNGLFHATSSGIGDADAQKWLAMRSGDHLLSRSLTTGRVYDVRFLTSTVSGKNSKPLETYAWLSILEGHVNSSSAQLSEAWTGLLAASSHDEPGVKPALEIPCPEGYEYELDSDFDEDEADEHAKSLPHAKRDSTTLQDAELGKKAEKLGSSSSSEQDGVSILSSLSSLPEEIIKDQEALSCPSSKPRADYGQTIVIEFAAHRTWHAFLWYCYTGRIEFCELRSQLGHGVRHRGVAGSGPPSCSPKSMYRLADLVGDNDLKALALNAIGERMSKINVLEETFSFFTSKYPDVRRTQLDTLIKYAASSEVKNAFLKKVSKSGILPYEEAAMKAFYDRLTSTITTSNRPKPATGKKWFSQEYSND